MRDSKVVHYMQIPLNIKPTDAIKTCFIVYSSREAHIDITIDCIETVLESAGKYDIKRLSIDGISGHSQYSQLLDFLNKCSLAIIILDGFRPNVIFEYGILVGLRKPCIVLLEENARIDIQSFLKAPFKKEPTARIDMDKDFSDVKDQMYIKYNYTTPKQFRELLNSELKKLNPKIEEAFMKVMFPEKEYIEKEIKESVVVFSTLSNITNKLSPDEEVKFRVCIHEIEKTAKKYDFELTLYYYYQKIQILINLDKYKEAAEVIDTLLPEHSSDTQLLLLKSFILNHQSKHELALKCLNDAIEKDYKKEVLWHQKALLLERLDRMDEAVLCYQKAVEYNKDCATVHYHYGILLLDNSAINDALTQFNKALKIRPTDSKYLVSKAICLNLLGQRTTAISTIKNALSFDENNADAWFHFGQFTDNQTEALKYFDKCLSISSNHSGALCSKGANLSNSGRLEEALSYLQMAMPVCSSYGKEGCDTVQGNLGRTKYQLYRSGQVKYKEFAIEAAEHFKKALDLTKDDTKKAEFLNNIGYIYLSVKNISEAKEYFTKSYETKTSDIKGKAVTQYNLGLAHLLEANYSKAQKLLSNVLTVTKKLPDRKCYVLYVPEIKEGNISLTELTTSPDIYECVKMALTVTRTFQTDVQY